MVALFINHVLDTISTLIDVCIHQEFLERTSKLPVTGSTVRLRELHLTYIQYLVYVLCGYKNVILWACAEVKCLFYLSLWVLSLLCSILKTLFFNYLFGLNIIVSLFFYSAFFFFETIIIVFSLGEYAIGDLYFLFEQYFSIFNFRIIHISQNWVAYLICTYKGILGLIFLFNFLFVIFWVSWFIYLLFKPVRTFVMFYLEEALLL